MFPWPSSLDQVLNIDDDQERQQFSWSSTIVEIVITLKMFLFFYGNELVMTSTMSVQFSTSCAI